MPATPAVILFIRADRLSRSLHALGLRKEALQLCVIAHDIVQSLWKINPDFYAAHLADSLLSISIVAELWANWMAHSLLARMP